MLSPSSNCLTFSRACSRLSNPPASSRSVVQFWGARSVGKIGGASKCAKTWPGLGMALSIATGKACLDEYAVQ
jgi:hypothetical protein